MRLSPAQIALAMIGLSAAATPAFAEPQADTPENGAEGRQFVRDVEAAFRQKEHSAAQRLSCRPPAKGFGLFGAVGAPLTRTTLAPVSARTRAFDKTDHFRRFADALFEMTLCFESPATKEICMIRPVERRDGVLCLR